MQLTKEQFVVNSYPQSFTAQPTAYYFSQSFSLVDNLPIYMCHPTEGIYLLNSSEPKLLY